MTAEELKTLLSTPAALFVLMICASLGSALKQMIVANRQDVRVTFSAYFLKHWPETLIMLGTNAGAFIGLIMTDSLNWAAAIGIGYLANDAADAFTPKGRSAQIQGGDRQGGFARVALLAVLALLSIGLLSGCATQSIDRQLNTSAQIHAAATRSVASALDAHVISSKDAEAYQEIAVSSSEILDSARDLKDVDPTTAAGKVQLANRILQELQDFLIKQLEKQP